MKKLLIMLSTVALSTTNVHAINSLITNEKTNTFSDDIFMSTLLNKKTSQFGSTSNQSVDWKEVRENVTNMFSSYSMSGSFSSDEAEMMQYAQTKTLEYLSKFEAKNSSHQYVINDLKNEFIEFKEEYEKNWNNNNDMGEPNEDWGDWVDEDNVWIDDGGMNPPPMNPPKDPTDTLPDKPKAPETPELPPNVDVPNEVKNGEPIHLTRTEESRTKALDVIDSIDVIGRTCSSLSVAAGLVAAGLWAAAWFFGISVPFAIAATAASAALAISAATISWFLQVNNLKIENVKTSVLDIALTVFAGIMAEAKLYLLVDFLVTTTVLTASSWVVPFVMGVFGVLVELASWIFWYNPEILG